MEANFLNIFAEFCSARKINRGCNSSFITLVPNVNDPLSLSDYRPINFIGCIYKVIAKVLANRLKRVIGSMICDVQFAFIAGRNIFDGPLVINESISWAKKTKREAILFKVDFEKALDSLSWSFLDSVMAQMGFTTTWRVWIMGFLSSARTSILVNGAPTKEFEIQKGVRQGEPLSPFLFIIAMEALHVVMIKAQSLGIFHGLATPNQGPIISHLFYADDAIFIGNWCNSNIKNLSRILRCFQLASALKVNFSKSRVLGISISTAQVASMANILHCQMPTRFL